MQGAGKDCSRSRAAGTLPSSLLLLRVEAVDPVKFMSFRSTRASRGNRSRMVIVIRSAHWRMMQPAPDMVLSLHLNPATNDGNQQPPDDSVSEPESESFVFHGFCCAWGQKVASTSG